MGSQESHREPWGVGGSCGVMGSHGSHRETLGVKGSCRSHGESEDPGESWGYRGVRHYVRGVRESHGESRALRRVVRDYGKLRRSWGDIGRQGSEKNHGYDFSMRKMLTLNIL